MKNTVLFVSIFFFSTSIALTQNYLFKKDKSGFSGFIGLGTKVNKDRIGISLGADYTFDGLFSMGVNRTFFQSNNVLLIKETKGYFTFNVSLDPLKLEKGKTTFLLPLILGISLIEGEQFFTYGARLGLRTQMSLHSSFTPIFSVISQPNINNIENPYTTISSVELNIIYQSFRIAPQFSISESDVRFGINLGFLL
jgi:hypothetical protein